MKNTQVSPKLARSQIGAILLTGIGVGWLAGLSLSPVAHIVITSVIGLAAAAVAALAGVELPVQEKDSKDEATPQPKLPAGPVNAFPIALLVLAVAGGAPLGILARTHQVFGVQELPTAEKKKEDKDDEKAKTSFRVGGLFAGEGVDLRSAAAYDQPGPILVELKGSKSASVQKFVEALNQKQAKGPLSAADVLQEVCKELLTND